MSRRHHAEQRSLRARMTGVTRRVKMGVTVLSFAAFALGPGQAEARKGSRKFDESDGAVDPRKANLPRRHRARLALHNEFLQLSTAVDPETGAQQSFFYAPLMLDLGYQVQFLQVAMFRLSAAAGPNMSNTRNAMPLTLAPQAHLGFQGRVFGLAVTYGYLLNVPLNIGASRSESEFEQPAVRNNHKVGGELSLTSRVDRVALSFALGLGGVRSNFYHYERVNEIGWRFLLSAQAAVYFDGTLLRISKAKKARESISMR